MKTFWILTSQNCKKKNLFRTQNFIFYIVKKREWHLFRVFRNAGSIKRNHEYRLKVSSINFCNLRLYIFVRTLKSRKMIAIQTRNYDSCLKSMKRSYLTTPVSRQRQKRWLNSNIYFVAMQTLKICIFRKKIENLTDC